jgi:hypothetical protein
MICPGSVGGPNKPNFHAATGTLAHEIAAGCLTDGTKPERFLGQTKLIDGFEVECDQEMVDHIKAYIHLVANYDFQLADQVWVEMPLLDVLQTVDKDFGGTADYVRYRPSTQELWTVDLKYGKGIYVDVTDNVQLRTYALGALLYVLRKYGFKVKRVRSTVFQPRYENAEPVRSEEFAAVELLDFAADLREAAERTRQPKPERVAGNHCTFCGKKQDCKEYNERHKRPQATASDFQAQPVAPTLKLF